MKKYFVFIAVVIFSSYSYSQDWKLKRNKNGIKIYTRKLDASKLYEYKAVMLVKTSSEMMLRTITDGNNLWKWNYKTSESKTLKKISDNEYIIWMENDFTWPVKNRDNISRLEIKTIAHGGYRVAITPDLLNSRASKRHTIRIKVFEGYWLIVPKGRYVELTQQIYGDPEGWLPSWVLNKVLTSAPYHSFRNLKELLEK